MRSKRDQTRRRGRSVIEKEKEEQDGKKDILLLDRAPVALRAG